MRETVNRSRNMVLAVAWMLVSVHVVLAWTARSPGISWGEDDAEYVILGREILNGSYAERWDVDAPAHARLPPAFPALLSITSALFGENVTAYTVLVLICSAASIVLFFSVVRRHFGDAVALLVTGLTAINTMAVSDAGYIMAEAPFRFWATLTLWAASRENPRSQDLFLAGASAVIAALTRSIGVTIIVALALHWVLERRWKAVALLAAGSIPVGLWFFWTVIAPDPGERALYLHTVISAVEHEAAGTQDSPWIALVKRITSAVLAYARTHVPVSLSFFGLKANPIDNYAWAALAFLTVPLGLRIAWQRWRLLVLLLGFYGAGLAAWPWLYGRFVSPVTSMLLAIIFVGAAHLLHQRGERTRRVVLAGIASLFVVGSIQSGLPTLRAMLACDRTRPLESPSCFTDDRRGLLQLAAYVRERTPADALFFVPKEGAFYLHSDRRTVRENRFLRAPADSLGPLLRRSGVSYTVITPIGINVHSHNALVAKACREFEKVATFDGDAILLRLRENGPIDHEDETCQLIAEWANGLPARWSQ